MEKKSDTVRYTATELEAMRHRGESLTDWAKVDAMSETELEASIAADPDDVGDLDWSQAIRGLPPRKREVRIPLDEDVLNWFKQTGQGYEARINSVLRAFVERQKRATP